MSLEGTRVVKSVYVLAMNYTYVHTNGLDSFKLCKRYYQNWSSKAFYKRLADVWSLDFSEAFAVF